MNLKKCLSAVLSLSMALSCIVLPSQISASAEGEDYGTVTNNTDGSTMLNFGNDSITVKGGGSIITDTVNGGVLRPDNLKTNDSMLAVLTMPSVDLTNSGYDKIDLYAASKNDAAVSIKVGETEIASFDNVNSSAWDSYKVNTGTLKTTDVSGNLTINITGAAKTYCGNYVYVKLYNSSAPSYTNPPATTAPVTATPKPSAPSDDTDLLPYQNESLSFEERAADLVSRMTLEEKAAQLAYRAPAIDRLGVKAYDYWKECLHGVARQGKATNFPAPLALSNTWNRGLIYSIADITSTEARGKNNRYNLSYYTPTINMARDPRWGRNDETYGEDPYLTGQLGGEFVKGMQGDDEKYTKIIATIKHFAANNNEANRRSGSSVMSEFNFRNYYTKVFQNVAEIEMPASVMSSYNATTIYRNGELLYNFKPSAGNYYLLTDLLRRNWGFDGYVTTDCGAGEDMTITKNNDGTYKVTVPQYQQGMLGESGLASEAYIAEALKAGMDVECSLGGGNRSSELGVNAVKNGYITEEQLETNIYHLFLQRFRTGEFDETSAYRDITSSVIETDENVAVAEKAAEESWVLLKNEDNTLPLKNVKNVAVVGNMANTLALGDYAGSPEKVTNPISGIRSELGAQGTEVSYLGEITDDEKLFNVKSINLVLKNGSKRAVDLSTATGVSGMTLANGTFTDVTQKAAAVISNVNFLDVASVEVEMATGSRIGGSLNIAYGSGGPTVAAINTTATESTDTYVVCTGAYTGEDGGYNGTADMYISASAAAQDFTVANYKTQLDAADVIIAYAGTIPKQDGFGTADSSESKDRSSIDLPSHQAHVQAICDAYPEKTVVVMSTVGQINVEPFKDKCKAILWTSYNGQTQGTALGKILTGAANPSGRLSTTWYKNDDVNKMELSNNSSQTIGSITGKYTNYDIQADGTNPGHTYQYYANTSVYPFGYGLSYTDFTYSNMTISSGETAEPTSQPTDTPEKTGIGYANGKVTIKADKNAEAAKLIHASYSGDTLDSVDITDVKLEADKSIEIPKTDISTGDRLMLWESIESMKPLCGEYTVEEAVTPSLNNDVDANDTVTLSIDVTNTGTVSGQEVVQLYVAHPQDGKSTTPKKQLKGFEKVELAPNETKTVEFELDVADMALYSELLEKNEVPTGTYTAYIAKNAEDTSNSRSFNVTGTLASVLKTVKAMPDGVSLNGLICEDGSALEAVTKINSQLSAVMSDEEVYDISKADVSYTSSNTDVAAVDSSGIVSSGAAEGVATITASVTVNGVTLTDSYPVVNTLKIKPSAEDIAAAKASLKNEYDKLHQAVYSAANLEELNNIYNAAITALEAADTKDALETALAKAINDLNSVSMDNLTEEYSIESVNPKHIEKGVIDYREGGIPTYNGASGTITNANPYSGIALLAKDASGNTLDASKLVWSVKKFDDSKRKVAEIDSATGELTIYGNGIIQITAADIENLKCARLMVQVNMQVEGEYADESNGADLADAQSGSSGGLDAGSTGNAWLEYKSVKLSNLDSISVRYAGKNAASIYVSLEKSTTSGVIASGSASATNGWSTWSDINLTLNEENLYNAQLNGKLDEYGCATVYVQTNGTNLDYFRLNYIENNDEIPYIIEKTLNKAGGKIKATLKYRGSTLATEVKLVAEVLDTDGETVKNTISIPVKGTGEFEITTGAADGETVRLTVKDNDENALSEYVDKVYNTPVDSEIVVYSLDDTTYDYTKLTGGTDKTAYTDTVNGLSGYGSWAIDKGASYTYTDVNEKTYDYTFTQSWKAGSGSTTNRCLYFTPTKVPCKVTAVFTGSEAARSMTVYQSDDNQFTQPGTGSVTGASLEITEQAPVYVYGGSSNKQLYAIIVEYYGSENAQALSVGTADDEAIDRPVQFIEWGDSRAVLTKHDATGETKVWTQAADGSRIQLDTSYFYEADVPYNYDDEYTINALAVYKDRLYAGCDNGLVIVFTDCVKCYKLKKACDIDIKQMSITDGIMYASDGETDVEISMSDIGGDSIEADEARLLAANGGVLIDVRSAEEFAEKSAEGSVNIPVDTLEEGLAAYDKDTALIFYCASGTRAAAAVEKAKEMGFTNVYNLGSINKLV